MVLIFSAKRRYTSDANNRGEDDDDGDHDEVDEDLQQGISPVAGIGVVQEGTHCSCIHLKNWAYGWIL